MPLGFVSVGNTHIFVRLNLKMWDSRLFGMDPAG